jgi:hypothetical protein
MFQYAAGFAVAKRIGARLLLDVAALSSRMSHYGFELPTTFVGEFDVATRRDLAAVLGWRTAVRNLLARRRFSWFPSARMVVEPQFAYSPVLTSVGSSRYLAGYWQSEAYFAGVSSEIRRSYAFVAPNPANADAARRMADCQSVSLHVRRGDYATNSRIAAVHGVCGPEYFKLAIDLIRSRIGNPRFFVFSDDLTWCKQSLELLPTTEFVSINSDRQSFNDMRLMSLCKHNIIANSTFSWWGAWLNANPQKIVVAPKRWFATDEDVSTTYPESWVKL